MVATAAAVVLLVPATAACLAYLVPTLAGLWPRGRRFVRIPQHRFTILIPAHNEESTLPATLASVAAQNYPPELVRTLVVADNCTDCTAAVAREAGAMCVVRTVPEKRGKGYAIAFGLDHVPRDEADVVLILDADCELNGGALRALDAILTTGADVVQCAVRSRNADDGPSGYVAAVGAAIDAGVADGLDRLGLSVPLRGTGMAFRREILEVIPWTAFSAVEDAEYARRLRAAGIRVRYCSTAVVNCESPRNTNDLCRQRRRWRVAGVLSSKPLVLAQLVLAAGVSLLCGLMWWPVVLVLLTAGIYGRAALVVGLTAPRLGFMLRSPGVVVRLGCLTLAGVFRGKPTTWDRTPRPEERRAP